MKPFRCREHDLIEGGDYTECKRCCAAFFMTSGGLWQDYDTGKRIVPKPPQQSEFMKAKDRI